LSRVVCISSVHSAIRSTIQELSNTLGCKLKSSEEEAVALHFVLKSELLWLLLAIIYQLAAELVIFVLLHEKILL